MSHTTYHTITSKLLGTVTILGDELDLLVKAIELDRLWIADAVKVLAYRREHPDEPIVWCHPAGRKTWGPDLMHGAVGLRPEHAPGELSVEDALRRVGLTLVRSEEVEDVDPRERLRRLKAGEGTT